jgi:hypothetical protein
MQRMSIAAFALLVMHLNAIGQVESDGTIVVAKWTPETIVVAADSRESRRSSYSDTNCKIAAFGNKLVFSASGRRSTRNRMTKAVLWDSFAVARQQYIRLTRKGTPDQLAMALASGWGEAVKKELEKIGGMAIDGLEDYIISNGIFADFDKDGTLSIAVEQVTYEIVDGKINIILSTDRVDSTKWSSYFLGHGEIVKEVTAGQTLRAIQWQNETNKLLEAADDKTSAFAIKMVELTIDNFPKTKKDDRGIPFSIMGRPIAVVQLTRGKGVTWIKPGKCVTR